MGRLIRTAKAEQDLIEIGVYIATDNKEAADKLLDCIDTKCQMLANNPELGQARLDIAPEMRYFPVGNYLILFKKINDGIDNNLG